jgi:hypothetical protein
LATPERWFIPNYLINYRVRDYSTPEWGSYFIDPTVLDETLSHTDVIQLWPVMNDEGNWLENLLPSIRKYNLKIAINAGYIGMEDPTYGQATNLCKGDSIAQRDLNGFIRPMFAKGASIDYIVVDGFPFFPLKSCKLSLSQAVPELVSYMKAIHQVYPNIKIGLDVNFPLWPYNGTISYDDPHTESLPDYKIVFDQIIAATSQAGEKITFLQVDNPYSYITEALNSDSKTVRNTNWVNRIVQLEKQARSYNIPFGLMYNTEGTTRTDQQYYEETLKYIDLYKENGGNPDQAVIISWYPTNPSQLLPPSKPYTFTNVYRDAMAKFGSVARVPAPSPTPSPTPSPRNPADISGPNGTPDNVVDAYDYTPIATDYGKTGAPGFSVADISGDKGIPDGTVSMYDYSFFVSNFGK